MISDVLVDDKSVGAVEKYTFEKVREKHTIEAVFALASGVADPEDTGVSDWLNTKDHTAYLSGYANGSFGPNKNMTRAEAAQMFYNLLLNQEVSGAVSFTDVAADAWYAKAVHTLASLGILQGGWVTAGLPRTVPSPGRSSRSLPCGLPTWIPAARTSLPM